MRSVRSRASVIVFALLGVATGFAITTRDTHIAKAVGTRTFELDTADKLGGGEQQGTAITSNGEVVAGWSTSRTTLLKGTSVWAGISDGADVLLGVGPDARVLKIDAQGKESVVAEIPTAMAVTSLVKGPGGKIYAGTYPDGEIYLVDPGAAVGTNPSATAAQKPKAWSKLPSDHVWALAYDAKRNELFAGTGPDGKIYRIDAAGKSQLFHTVDDTHVTSLTVGPTGTLYAGTSSKGLLLAISAPGKAAVVMDFAGNYVRSCEFGGAMSNGVEAPVAKPKDPKAKPPAAPVKAAGASTSADTLYCIVNDYPSLPDASKGKLPSTKQPGASSDAPKSSKGKGELWKISGLAGDGTGGKPEKLYADSSTPFFALATEPAPKAGKPVAYIGLANEGKVVAVDETHVSSVVAKAESRQIGAIGVVAGGKGSWFAAGDGGAFHRVTGIGGGDASWTSKTLDAGLKAHWGKLAARADGPLDLETRSGETSVPDETWSAWTGLAAGGKVASPSGRFVQIKARWKGFPTVLHGISLAFVTDNLRAIVTEVGVPAKGSLPSGIPSSGTDVPKKESAIKLTWKVENPDSDALRYRLWFRKEESTVWRALTKDDEPISATEYSWSTEALAEGWYRVRVEASDEVANPINTALKHALDSAPFVVDNTPPVIRKMALNGGKLQAEIADGVGPIVRLEVEIDGKAPWRVITSTDGILDDALETVDVPLGLTGSHVIGLRAYDAAGNSVTREVEGK